MPHTLLRWWRPRDYCHLMGTCERVNNSIFTVITYEGIEERLFPSSLSLGFQPCVLRYHPSSGEMGGVALFIVDKLCAISVKDGLVSLEESSALASRPLHPSIPQALLHLRAHANSFTLIDQSAQYHIQIQRQAIVIFDISRRKCTRTSVC